MSPIDNILSLLTKVRPGRAGQWMACCPAHEDKSPSLRVRENTDGAVLPNCLAGYIVADVVAGKSGSDLQGQVKLLHEKRTESVGGAPAMTSSIRAGIKVGIVRLALWKVFSAGLAMWLIQCGGLKDA